MKKLLHKNLGATTPQKSNQLEGLNRVAYNSGSPREHIDIIKDQTPVNLDIVFLELLIAFTGN